jgi:hypothetical protein
MSKWWGWLRRRGRWKRVTASCSNMATCSRVIGMIELPSKTAKIAPRLARDTEYVVFMSSKPCWVANRFHIAARDPDWVATQMIAARVSARRWKPMPSCGL